MKGLGFVFLDKNIFEKYYFWPRDLLLEPTGTVRTILVGNHPKMF